MPTARNGQAISRAPGYWFDWTPTRATRPKLPLLRNRASNSGTLTRVFVSSITSMATAMSGPRTWRLCAIGRDAVEGGQRVRRNHRAPPTDHVAVVVIVRRLDQNEWKRRLAGTWTSDCHLILGRPHRND